MSGIASEQNKEKNGTSAAQAIDLTASQALSTLNSTPNTTSNSTLESSKAIKRRRAMTDADRRNIRRYKQENPSAKHTEIAVWFSDKFNHKIVQSTVTDSLSAKYDRLDYDNRKDKYLTQAKAISADYPPHDAALFEWQQAMQKKKATITGEVLKAKAHDIWLLFSQYRDLLEPKWSNGWLSGFNNRHNIREFVIHGEAASAEVNTSENIQLMAECRAACKDYLPRDVLNMDEMALFWKLSPDRTLATESGSGPKQKKDRITLALTVNADGSEKFDPWIIGKAKNPCCFKKINRHLLGVHYRYNKTKWMTGLVCKDYLEWLNNKMKAEGRKVLLFMDNFSGHELAVKLCGGSNALSNVKVLFLPKNTTSHWQSCDQGIINSFKLHYRRQWVAFMIKCYEENKDSFKLVTLLHAINWTTYAWNNHVSSAGSKELTETPRTVDTQSICGVARQKPVTSSCGIFLIGHTITLRHGQGRAYAVAIIDKHCRKGRNSATTSRKSHKLQLMLVSQSIRHDSEGWSLSQTLISIENRVKRSRIRGFKFAMK